MNSRRKNPIFCRIFFCSPLTLCIDSLLAVSPVNGSYPPLTSTLIQFAMFLGFWAYYAFTEGSVRFTLWALTLPLLMIQVMLLGLGVGIIISSLTTKYRDLAIAVGFGVQLWMYATPVVYSMASLHNQPKLAFLVNLNPMTAPVEIFRMATLGTGTFTLGQLAYSVISTLVLLVIGVVLFSRIEKTFMDTV